MAWSAALFFYGFTAYTGNLYTLYTVIRRVYAENPRPSYVICCPFFYLRWAR